MGSLFGAVCWLAGRLAGWAAAGLGGRLAPWLLAGVPGSWLCVKLYYIMPANIIGHYNI